MCDGNNPEEPGITWDESVSRIKDCRVLADCLIRQLWILNRDRPAFFLEDDRFRRTVAFASSTLHTQIHIDVGLGFTFGNGIALAAGRTGAAQDT